MMDTHENDIFDNEQGTEHIPVPAQEEIPAEPVDQVEEEPVQAYQQPPQQQYYHNAGTGRKESPFADSPYVMNHQNQNYANQGSYTNVPPVPPKPQKVKKHSSGKVWKGILAAVLAVAVIGGSCGLTAALVNSRWEKETAKMETSFNQKINDLQKQVQSNANSSVIVGDNVSTQNGLTPSQVYAMNVNSVVAISNQATTNVYGQTVETASSGSGFIISEDGYVVSNYHVVEGASSLTVITFDGTEYPAQLIGYDASNDISLLKVEASGLDPVTIGSSDELIVGDQVVAIGNPLGELTSTLTVGYISAKDRTINTDGTYGINMMQTDAAINSGNSGGPLFNMEGEVIGITTAKYSGSSGSGASIEGIGFAIPMDDVYSMLEDLRDHGYVTGAYLGVTVQSLDASTAALYSLPTGSLVSTVEEDSCAAKAGIRPQDIITGLGGYEVSGNSDLLLALRKFKAGDTTTIDIFRGGQELELTITLDEKPAPVAEEPQQTQPAETQPSDNSQTGGFPGFFPFFGFGG